MLRCGTREAMGSAHSYLGLSGKLNTAFVERLKKDAATDGGSPHPPDLVDSAGSAAAAPPSGVVAGILSLRAAGATSIRGG
jgi:hypothetical protein